MEEFLPVMLQALSVPGFLETRALLYMDIIVSYLALLPILSGMSIFLAIRGCLKSHQFTQTLLFILSLVALFSFAWIVFYQEGFDALLELSSIDYNKAMVVLIFHSIVSVITVTLWMFTLMYALADKKRRALPGVYSESHAKSGRRIFKGIVLISFSSVGLYWILFIA